VGHHLLAVHHHLDLIVQQLVALMPLALVDLDRVVTLTLLVVAPQALEQTLVAAVLPTCLATVETVLQAHLHKVEAVRLVVAVEILQIQWVALVLIVWVHIM
jgi:hypothetical protein